MNPAAVPSLVSALFLFTLSLISVSYGKRDKVNWVFALFILSLSLTTFSSFIFYNAKTQDSALRWSKLAFVFAVPTVIVAFYYVLVITDDFHRQRLRFLNASAKTTLWGVMLLGLILELVNLFSNTIISGVRFYSHGDFEHTYGPIFTVSVIYFLAVSAIMLILLYRAYRAAELSSKRDLLLYNLLGFLTTFFLFAIVRLLLPAWHVTTYSLSFIPFTISVVIFILGIMRYQFRQITELNTGLEQIVAERTRKLREAQAQLVQSGKMAALAELVAGVSHEMNNPVGAVQSNRGILKHAVTRLRSSLAELTSSKSTQEQIERILHVIENTTATDEHALDRINEVVKNLKSFALLDQADVVRTRIETCIDSALSLLEHEIGERIMLVKEYGDTPKIKCQARHLNQAFMDILLNAIQAIEETGKITITTDVRAGFVRIGISDTGCGIAPENINDIFDPGFTTKGVGVGTGLGLAITYQIIQRHSGKIRVTSELGKGTKFVIEIPINEVSHNVL